MKTSARPGYGEFDDLLRSDTPLGKLKSSDLDWPSVLALHADFATRQFAAPCLASTCEGCARSQAESTVSFSWKGIFHTAGTTLSTFFGMLGALGGHGITVHRVIEFQTHHALCQACLRRARWLRHVGELMEYLTFILLLIGLPMVLLALIIGCIVLGSRISPREGTMIAVGMLGGGLALATAWFLGRRAPGCGVPPRLKFIAKRPFRLVSVRLLN